MKVRAENDFPMSWTLALGALWGTLEIFGGAALKEAGLPLISGSVLTAASGFFLVMVWQLTDRLWSYPLAVAVAALFRILNSLTLHLPAVHHSFGNHVFGMVSEALVLAVFLFLLRNKTTQRAMQSALGAAYALTAALIFPVVRLFTGNPACTYPQTNIPVALVFAPLAMLLAAVLIPLGFQTANNLRQADFRAYRLRWSLPGLTFALLLLSVLLHV